MAESRKNGRKRSGGSRRNRRTVIGLAAVFFCALLTVIVIQILLRYTISRYDPDVIISGVYVGETDVSGMTREQAKEAVLTPSLAQRFLFTALQKLERGEIVPVDVNTENLWPVE